MSISRARVGMAVSLMSWGLMSWGLWSTSLHAQPPTPATPPAPAAASEGNPVHERLKLDAENAYQNNDFAKCIELTGRVLAENPKDDVALYLRASARVELGQIQRNLKEVRAGIEDAREALRNGGTDQVNYYLPYFYGMTALSQLEGKREHADVVVSFVKQVLDKPGVKPEDRANLLYQRASAEVYLGDYPGAARDFEAAIVAVPQHVGARLGLADSLARQKKMTEALAAFTGAVQAVPNNPLVYNNRGMFLQGQGKTQEAIADFTRAIELDNSYAVAYTNRGFAAMSEGNAGAAESDFTAALKIDPDQPVVHSLRGTSRLSQGNPKAAVDDYQQVLKIDPRNPLAHADLGFAKYFAGDFAGSLQAFDQAVSMDPNLRYLNPWRYWTAIKSGQAAVAPSKLGDSLTKPADKRDWGDQLAGFLSGTVSEQQLLAAAEPKEEALRKAQLCEAFYFQAEKRAAAGDRAGAEQLYNRALETKQTHLSAYRGAQFALKKFPQ